MIELTKEKDVYEVSVTAKIGVARTIRVSARGELHARQIAERAAKDDTGPNDWVFTPTGHIIRLDADDIHEVISGMCPVKITPDAYDKNGVALFIGDDIRYNRAVEGIAKVRVATINDVSSEADRKTIWCDGNLFSMRPEDVTKA